MRITFLQVVLYLVCCCSFRTLCNRILELSHRSKTAQTTHTMASTNGIEQTAGLKILIVGAGIGGLTAAIGLRKQGHHVQIFKQSRFATETGAALHLAPNANGILRRLGLFPEDFGANPIQRVNPLQISVPRHLLIYRHLEVTEYTASGDQLHTLSVEEANKRWQHVCSRTTIIKEPKL